MSSTILRPSKPVVGDTPDVLATLEEISSTWLQQVFEADGLKLPLISSQINIEPIGNGTLSNVARVHYQYDESSSDTPAPIVAKFPPTSADVAAAANERDFYRREVCAYRYLKTDTKLRIPNCYFAEISDEGVFNLVLEDLTGKGYPGDQIKGCGIAEAKAVVKTLADLHANYRDVDSLIQGDWISHYGDQAAVFGKFFGVGASIFRERYADRISEESLSIIDQAAPLIEAWASAKRHQPCLIHTDPRVDNIFFENTSSEVSACLIDLQLMSIGDPAYDLAYFLSGSLSVEDRRHCERELVNLHSAKMANIVAEYDADMAWQRYRAHSLAGLLGTVGAAALIARSEHNDNLLCVLAERNIAAIMDQDGIEAARDLIAGIIK